MNDQRGIEVETAGGSADQWRLRRPPELLLPLMRAARPSTTLHQLAWLGRLAPAPRPSRWANSQFQLPAVAKWPHSFGKSER
jgi:hypothetical protein